MNSCQLLQIGTHATVLVTELAVRTRKDRETMFAIFSFV